MKDLTAESSRVASGFQQPNIPSHHGSGINYLISKTFKIFKQN